MYQYLKLLKDIKENGVSHDDRTGVGTRAVFGRQIRFDLADGFPIITTKKMAWKAIRVELLWFLAGQTNIEHLHEHKVHIWDDWANEDGEVGPVYGKQWRKWSYYKYNDNMALEYDEIDQIQLALDTIKDPKGINSRRIIVSAWNPVDIPKMGLPSCHCFFQLRVMHGKIHLQMYMRSADVFLGVPFNISCYALLLEMFAYHCDLEAGELIVTFGDVHIYNNLIDQVDEQLKRLPYELPELDIKPRDSIFDHEYTDFTLENYNHDVVIKGEVAV